MNITTISNKDKHTQEEQVLVCGLVCGISGVRGLIRHKNISIIINSIKEGYYYDN